jgi:capsular exopolysaccharide synthesis family protein
MSGVGYTMYLPKIYMASSRIQVREDAPDRPVFERQMTSPYNPFFIKTQYEIIQSREMLSQVLDDLKLPEKWGEQGGYEGGVMTREDALARLKGSIRVNQYRDTTLLDIQVYNEDRMEAAAIANQLATVYRDYRLSEQRGEIQRAVDALREELKTQQQAVEDAENELERIRRETGFTDTIRGYTPEKQRIAQLESERGAAQVAMLVSKTRFDQISGLTGRELLDAAQYMVSDMTLANLRRQFVESEVMLKQMLESYGENHPQVKQAKAARDELERKVNDQLAGLKRGIQAAYEMDKTKFDALDQQLADAKSAVIEAAGATELPFERAQRNVELRREILTALLSRVTQEGIELGASRTPVIIIEKAVPPLRYVSPKIPLNILLSVLLGVVAGVSLAFFIEYLDTSAKTVDDVERMLGLPVIGVVPQKVRPLIEEGMDSPHGEAYRVLRTSMILANRELPSGAIAVVSGGMGEGKSTTLFNLAYTCANLGDRVIIVDSDLRRPVQHAFLGVRNRPGLTDILTDGAALESVVQATSVPNLHFLPSGRSHRMPLGLLDSTRMRSLIDELKSRYTYVFFDTPPIVGVSDGSIIASLVDSVLLVVQYRKYPRQVILRAKRMLQNTGCSVVGIVLNNINIMRDDEYYYYATSEETTPEPAAKPARPAGKRDAL